MEAEHIDNIAREGFRQVQKIAEAIMPTLCGNQDATGTHVESLTEAVMGVTAGLVRIAESIGDLAAAIREKEEQP